LSPLFRASFRPKTAFAWPSRPTVHYADAPRKIATPVLQAL